MSRGENEVDSRVMEDEGDVLERNLDRMRRRRREGKGSSCCSERHGIRSGGFANGWSFQEAIFQILSLVVVFVDAVSQSLCLYRSIGSEVLLAASLTGAGLVCACVVRLSVLLRDGGGRRERVEAARQNHNQHRRPDELGQGKPGEDTDVGGRDGP